jgi:hypothetical protein
VGGSADAAAKRIEGDVRDSTDGLIDIQNAALNVHVRDLFVANLSL